MRRFTRLGPLTLLLLASCSDDAGTSGRLTEEPVVPLVFPDEPFRATRPMSGAPLAFDPPRPESFTLESGVTVLLVERHTVPHVSWYLSFPVGSMMDPPGKEGLSSLCTNVAFQGSVSLDRSSRDNARDRRDGCAVAADDEPAQCDR